MKKFFVSSKLIKCLIIEVILDFFDISMLLPFFLNKFLFKYKDRLLIGLFITIIARLFSLVTPRLVGDSMTTIENYLNLNTISPIETREVLLTNIIFFIKINQSINY